MYYKNEIIYISNHTDPGSENMFSTQIVPFLFPRISRLVLAKVHIRCQYQYEGLRAVVFIELISGLNQAALYFFATDLGTSLGSYHLTPTIQGR